MANAYNEKMIKNDTDYVLVTESTGAIFRVSLLDLLGDLASDENVTMIQNNLQSQLDGQVIAWFYDYAPTLSNAPASLWTTEALRDQHANDTFTHLTTGQSWRWVYDTGAWKWLEIADTATTAALAAASQAQDTADGKRRVFVAQPTVPYDVGDLWADGSTVLRCVTPKTSTGSYVVGDWVAVADKTDYANTETFPAVVTPTAMKRTGSTLEPPRKREPRIFSR